jgi:hypothetical protein
MNLHEAEDSDSDSFLCEKFPGSRIGMGFDAILIVEAWMSCYT